MHSGQLMMMMVIVVVTMVITWCPALTRANGFNHRQGGHPQQRQPRCSASNKPCRTRAVMSADFLPSGSRVVQSPPGCACPPSSPCSEDWESHRDRVITRELLTNGNISMTFSMMYCGVVQPQRRCTPGEISLQLTGWTPVPTEIDFLHCTCPEHRPLLLHSISTGPDHRQYHAFVCANHKARCRTRRRPNSSPDICMETDPSTPNTVNFPCRCTSSRRSSRSCLPDSSASPTRYICKRFPRYSRGQPPQRMKSRPAQG